MWNEGSGMDLAGSGAAGSAVVGSGSKAAAELEPMPVSSWEGPPMDPVRQPPANPESGLVGLPAIRT